MGVSAPAQQDSTDRPSGTVSLLLTDIQGSTTLWETAPDQMPGAVSAHYALIDRLVSAHRGYRPQEQGEGDSTMSAFADASDAVACAVAIQRELAADPAAQLVQLRVRIGLHTGEVQLRDEGNYFGPHVNRAARVRNAAHGGQIVISEATRDLVADDLPLDLKLTDLGFHELRGLGRPEHLYELTDLSFAATFPPLRTVRTAQGSLPTQLTNFVGRSEELTKLRELLDNERLITLTGPGGSGKTRLAAELARNIADSYSDGAWFIDLSSLSDPSLVADAVATVVGVREVPTQPFAKTLLNSLRHKQMLLIFDNCEHVVEEVAELVTALLTHCSGLVVLATSREVLGVEGEVVFRTPPLSLEATDSEPDGVKLFIDRASKIKRQLSLEGSAIEQISEICRAVDGLPLAIELASARVRALSLSEILGTLEDRFLLFSGGRRTALPRHQTLAACIDWSHELLNDEERRVFRRLSVFVGTFTLEAAAQVTETRLDELIDLVTALLDKSLVQAEEGDGVTRLRLLETMRHYGLRKLADADETDMVRDRHLSYFRDLAIEAHSRILTAEGVEWLDRLEAEQDNIRACVSWAVDRKLADPALDLARSLSAYWLTRGHLSEGRDSLEELLGVPGGDPLRRAQAQVAACPLWFLSFDFGSVNVAAQQGLEVAREHGDAQTEGRALNWQAWVANVLDPQAAGPVFEQSIEKSRSVGDRWCLSYALNGLGFVQTVKGEGRAARTALKEALDLSRSSGDTVVSQQSLAWLAWSTLEEGDYEQATAYLEECLVLAQNNKDLFMISVAEMWLGLMQVYLGDHSESQRTLEHALAAAEELGNPVMTANAKGWLGYLNLARNDPNEAVGDLDHALSFFRSVGATWFLATYLVIRGHAHYHLGDLEEARSNLSEGLTIAESSAQRWSIGRSKIGLALIARESGDHQGAEELLQRALDALAEAGYVPGVAEVVDAMAGLAIDVGDFARGLRLFGASVAIRTKLGSRRFQCCEEALLEDVFVARTHLAQEADDLELEGAHLSYKELIDYARRARNVL